MSSAIPTEKMSLSTSDSANGESPTTLTITYLQKKVFTADRYFEIHFPKNPIHYIENGFVPTSAIPVTDTDTLAVTAELDGVSIYDASYNTYNAGDDTYGGFSPTIGWAVDVLTIKLTNVDDNTPTDASPKTWTFTVYPFQNPPSSKQVTT